MSDDYKRIAQRIFDEVFGQGKLEVADEIIAPDFIDHEMSDARGPEALKEAANMLRAAFSGLKFSMEDTITEGDQIAIRFLATGTHTGEFAGAPASGKPISVNGIDIIRFEGGKAVEHWGFMDQVGLMQQIGAMPQ
jgi:predicted ester cyclase